MLEFGTRQTKLFKDLMEITAPDDACGGARCKISVQHDGWQTPMRTNFYGVVVTYADVQGCVIRRLLALIKTPLDVLESTADVAADQMSLLFRPLLPVGAGVTLEDIIGTSTSDTEAAAMKVRCESHLVTAIVNFCRDMLSNPPP